MRGGVSPIEIVKNLWPDESPVRRPISIGLWFLLIIASGISPASAADIIGTAGKISDGDTLWICDDIACQKIRLCGIDAPEIRNEGGPEVRGALLELAADKTVRCTPVGEGTVCDDCSRPTSWVYRRLSAPPPA
jgi:endonuclease YncB( thermonuclease family)